MSSLLKCDICNKEIHSPFSTINFNLTNENEHIDAEYYVCYECGKKTLDKLLHKI